MVSLEFAGSYPAARPMIDHSQPQLAPSAGSVTGSVKTDVNTGLI